MDLCVKYGLTDFVGPTICRHVVVPFIDPRQLIVHWLDLHDACTNIIPHIDRDFWQFVLSLYPTSPYLEVYSLKVMAGVTQPDFSAYVK